MTHIVPGLRRTLRNTSQLTVVLFLFMSLLPGASKNGQIPAADHQSIRGGQSLFALRRCRTFTSCYILKPFQVSENPQEMTKPMVPFNDSIVQANITTVGHQVFLDSASGKSDSPVVLPDQTPVAMLSRLREIISFNWTPASSGVLGVFDLELLLRNNAELNPLLLQFALYRANIRVFLRINTNQFYSGALMLSWWPRRYDMGKYRQQRCILHPITVSAATQQSAELLIPYPHQKEWMETFGDPTDQQVYLCVEVLSPLVLSSSTLTDTVKIQLYAAFDEPKLQLNRDPEDVPLVTFSGEKPVKQSKLEITKKKGDTSFKSTLNASPARDAIDREKQPKPVPFSTAAPTLSSIPILGDIVGSLYDLLKIGTGVVKDLAPTVSSLAPLAPMLLDKPEVRTEMVRASVTNSYDMCASDVADASMPATWSRDNYAKMLKGFGLRFGHWTLAQYAQLPAIVSTLNFTTVSFATQEIPTTGTNPLSYLKSKFRLWRGSVKMRLQFFTSAFVSARFALYITPLGPDSEEFDDHIVTIIDVKGDTVTDVTIPYVSKTMWLKSTERPYKILLKLIAPIIGVDSALDGNISVVTWMAAGPDVQFACVEPTTGYTYVGTNVLPVLEAVKTKESVRRLTSKDVAPKVGVGVARQSAVQHDFETKPFPAIVDGCSYTIDNAYCVSDAPVSFMDILKRYQYMNSFDPRYFYNTFDPGQTGHDAFLRCFAARRGGYRLKYQASSDGIEFNEVTDLVVQNSAGAVGNTAAASIAGDNHWHHVSFPWCDKYPWALEGVLVNELPRVSLGDTVVWYNFVAARDDFELGLPTFPLSD